MTEELKCRDREDQALIDSKNMQLAEYQDQKEKLEEEILRLQNENFELRTLLQADELRKWLENRKKS